jgi:hypothetical protein
MPSRNSPCSCGSGKRFKHCCGQLTVDTGVAEGNRDATPYDRFGDFQQRYRGQGMLPLVQDMPPGVAACLDWVPPGIMVLEDYLNAATCDRWTDYFSRQESTPVRIQKVDDVAPGSPPQFVLDERRITERVRLGALEDEVKDVLFGAYREEILPHFGKDLDWMDRPDVLKYLPGGKYIAHSDNEYWDMSARRWVRSMDRDLSVLLYVNDDYEGGAVYFQNFDIRIKPSRGMLIAFPSDHRYLHAAESLISGSRFAVVCWSSIKGVEKLHPIPPGVTRL